MMRRMVMFASALLTLGAGIAYAAIPNTSDYLHKTTPMISGTVFSVDDRTIVVDTDQGQRVTMVMDSQTMLPTDLAPGMVMRAEVRVMENGQYYVNRITPIREARNTRRAEAYGHYRRHDWDPARANTTPAYAHPTTSEQSVATEQSEPTEPVEAADRAKTSHAAETLPQTAGNQPLIGLLGLLALSGAGALMLTRRLSRV